MTGYSDTERLAALASGLDRLSNELLKAQHAYQNELEQIPQQYRSGARNLLHYLELSKANTGELQRHLDVFGFCRLDELSMEVLPCINRMMNTVSRLSGSDIVRPCVSTSESQPAAGNESLEENARALLGPLTSGDPTRTIVTVDSYAATNYEYIRELIEHGVSAFRINCAKDTEAIWSEIISYVRRASAELGRSCRVLCDLPGPRARTVFPGKVSGEPGEVEAFPSEISLRAGDSLLLAEAELSNQERDLNAKAVKEQIIHSSKPEILRAVRVGDRVVFDDGKITGVVRRKTFHGLTIEIVHCRKEFQELKSGKGMNFPDTKFSVPFAASMDSSILDFVLRESDLVGLSFIRSAEDVQQFVNELESRDKARIGMVLKIETREACESLPEILLAGLQRPPFGIMIARGDLAVEAGFDQLGVLQEEIFRLSSAAYVPVIWATQVLENLTKCGLPSRAEVTDAFIGVQASGVMLNKGKNVLQSVQFLQKVSGIRPEEESRKHRVHL